MKLLTTGEIRVDSIGHNGRNGPKNVFTNSSHEMDGIVMEDNNFLKGGREEYVKEKHIHTFEGYLFSFALCVKEYNH